MISLPGKHYVAAIIWCILLGGVYLLIDARIKPKIVTPGGQVTEIVIPRSSDGHFHVAGTVNGHALVFLVDTGASTVSINRRLAQQMGLPRGKPIRVNTANGTTQGEELDGQTLSLGGIRLNNTRIIVLAQLADEALLGQNVLRHLDVIQTGEQMILKAKATPR